MPSPAVATVFETPRLIGRGIEPTDVDALHAVYGDIDAMRWVGDGSPLDRAQCEHWVDVTRRNYASRGYGMFAVISRESHAVVGFCGLVHPGGQVEAELKYAYQRERWGRGFASEAASALLAAADPLFGLQHVIATTAPQNLASHRVLLKAGMQFSGVRCIEDGIDIHRFDWWADSRKIV